MECLWPLWEYNRLPFASYDCKDLITLRDIELFILIFFHQMPGFAFQLRAICSLLAVQTALGSLRTFNFTVHTAQRSPGLWIESLPSSPRQLTQLPIDGYSREVYLINGQQPGPMIEVDEGDDVEVFVRNELPVSTTIHWHGMLSAKCMWRLN